MTNIYVDIHALQSLPPSNLNRDDTGSPKTAMFGGVRRARVSSQSWKKAMRDFFDEGVRGKRTLNAPSLISERIRAIDPAKSREDADKLVATALKVIGKKGIGTEKSEEGDDEKTKALFFISAPQVDHVARIMLGDDDGEPVDIKDKKDLKKRITKALQEGNSIDMALFGRMVADDPDINVDAAAQVAHAIGVAKVTPEFDFFTAVDDDSREEHAGAAMMGTVEFNSSVYYRYANVGLNQLSRNLGDDEGNVVACVKDFIRAFIESLPTGKQNTNAAQTLPATVVVEIRNTRPVSYAGAFESPVVAREGLSVSQSAERRLRSYAESIRQGYASLRPVHSFVLSINGVGVVSGLGEVVDEDGLIERVGEVVEDELGK